MEDKDQELINKFNIHFEKARNFNGGYNQARILRKELDQLMFELTGVQPKDEFDEKIKKSKDNNFWKELNNRVAARIKKYLGK